MIDLNFKYKELLAFIKSAAPFEPEIAVILGSGLGTFAERVKTLNSIHTADIPQYPPSTIEGHKGVIHFSEYEGKKLLLFQGRVHFYEGYRIWECVLPVLIAHNLGCKKIR